MIELTNQEFIDIRDIMYAHTGVFLKESKKALVFARLRKHIEELGLKSFADYIKLLKMNNRKEMEFFVNAITTNETFFFRGMDHFDFLEKNLFADLKAGRRPSLKIWSAASSTGEESYSVAMHVLEKLPVNYHSKVKIIASDINSDVLAQAKTAIYRPTSLKSIPPALKTKYFTEKKGTLGFDFVLDDKVKRMVTFKQHNIKQVFSEKMFDVVFLRNVLIYFDPESKEKVIEMISKVIRPGGYLFLGHAESLMHLEEKFKYQYVRPSVFKKD